MQVKPGDKVIYSKYAGTEVKLDGDKLMVIRQGDILAIVEDWLLPNKLNSDIWGGLKNA